MITVIKKVSERTTWDAIQKDVDEGKAGEYQIGTIVVETLKDGRQMPYVLAATNHYQQDELIFINMENYGDHCMNKRDANKGGWNKSEMRRHANKDILALLPGEMAAVIAPRTIVEIENDGTRILLQVARYQTHAENVFFLVRATPNQQQNPNNICPDYQRLHLERCRLLLHYHGSK